jgi:DNA repair exonuclease SbcCD ATPase subunit
MRFITFKTLQARNFLSFGDTPCTVNLLPGVNAITGINLDKEDSKNGAGKSSITEILYYCLYGSTLREISKDHIQNSLTKKRPEVSLVFDLTVNNVTDTYKIVRKLNPTKCSLFKNDEDVTRSTLVKTNNLIQNLIHTPSTVFQNSVIMSVNNAMPFMALSKTDKRKFIESVLGLEVFTTMVLKVRDDYSIAKKDYEIAYNKLEQLQTELQFNETQLNNYETLKQERLTKLESKKDGLVKDIQVLEIKLQTLQTAIDIEVIFNGIQLLKSQKETITSEQTKIQTQLHKLEAEKNSTLKQIDQLNKNKDQCPTCKQKYSEEHNKHIQTLLTTYNNTIEETNNETLSVNKKINDLSESGKKIDTKLSTLESAKQKHDANQAEVNNTNVSIKHLKQNLQDAEDEIVHVTKEHNNDLKSKVTDLKQKVTESQDKVNKLNNELNILETVKFVISEEGIKSFIVKKILKVLNSRLAYYLKKLEANNLCQFNEFFDEEIIDENSQPKSYFNFSGGERKRIDLACLFAFADIRRLQGDVNFSTVFYDELLDSSLDDKGVLLTLRVLRERFQENNESCYIITHRGPEVLTKAEHVIKVTKQNGITSVSS